MDERTEIENHAEDLLSLNVVWPTDCILSIEKLVAMESQLRGMKMRFAHTFFHPNRHANDYSCKCHGSRCAN